MNAGGAPLIRAIGAGLIAGLTASVAHAQDARPVAVQPVEQRQAQTAAQLQSRLPIRRGQDLAIIRADAQGKTLVITYRLDRPASEVDIKAWRAGLAAELTAFVCGNARMRDTAGQGGRFSYVYLDAQNKPLVRIDIAGEDCRTRQTAAQAGPKPVNQPGAAAREALSAALLEKLAVQVKQANAGLPQKIDQLTTLVKLELRNKALIHTYRLNVAKETINARSLASTVAAANCSGQDTRALLEIGASYSHLFYDSQGALAAQIGVKLTDCTN